MDKTHPSDAVHGGWHAEEVMQQEDQQSVMSVTVEWGSMSIAAMALAVSIWAAWYSTRRSVSIAKQLSQNDSFMRIHELLIDPRAASGRRRLFLVFTSGNFPEPGSSDWDDINYSLALYDTLGGYIQHGFIQSRMALASWHDPLVRIAEPARAFAAHRQGDEPVRPWSFLMALLTEAEEFNKSVIENNASVDYH